MFHFEEEKEIETSLQKILFSLDQKEQPWIIKEKKIKSLEKEIVNKIITKKEYNFSLEKKELENRIKEIIDKKIEEKFFFCVSEQKKRIDGRGFLEIRPIEIKINFLKNNTIHGNAFFSRGSTQVLSIVTLGKLSEKQTIENYFLPSYQTYFFHHYNFLNFSVNKITNSSSLSRREIGHGELIEKTFNFLLPRQEELPYAIRVVSEILCSDGSSSQASICSTSLALVSAGIPLLRMAAGISIGHFSNFFLVDMSALEDHISDMDFKIAGTEIGICSSQLDVKNCNISFSIIKNSLKVAKTARLQILEKMKESINKIQDFSRIFKWKKIYIGINKIGLIIGTGGKTINELMEKTKTSIEIQQDGFLIIYYQNIEQLNKVSLKISELMRESEKKKTLWNR